MKRGLSGLIIKVYIIQHFWGVEQEDLNMAARKVFLGPPPSHPELDRLREATSRLKVTDKQLAEQRISFVYGNAPVGSTITKESARLASKRFRMRQD